MAVTHKELIGLDIGSHQVKAIQLKKEQDGYQLIRAGQKALPPEGRDSPLTSCLQSLFAEEGFPLTAEIALALPRSAVTITKTCLPRIADHELPDYLALEIEQITGWEPGSFYLDFQHQHMPGFSVEELLVTAVQQTVVNELIASVKKAGLTPTIIDVDILALENQFLFNYPDKKEKTVILLDIGAEKTIFSLICEGTTTFSTWITKGLTHAQQPEGEKRKEGNLLNTALKKKWQRVQQIVSLPSVSEVIICGSVHELTILKTELENIFSLPVSFCNPLKKIKSDLTGLRQPALYATAVGLAMRL